MNKNKTLITLSQYLSKGVLLLVFSLFSLLAVPQSSFAQGIPETACDPEYMDALEARAFLEAQREITQNQNLILKPDSVLEYTCFDRILMDVANGGGIWPGTENFSESLIWGGVVGQNGISLDMAFLDVLLAGAIYDFENFSHSLNPNYDAYLHGRASPLPPYDLFDPVEGISDIGSWTGFNTSYTCSQMSQVWAMSQCMNFLDEVRDGFYDFNWFMENDPRKVFNENLSCMDLSGGIPPIEEIDIDVAFNDQAALYFPNNNPYDDSEFYEEDPVMTYLDLILPENIVGCVGPIPTGVTVGRQGTATYPDAFCPNPGCHYSPGEGGGSCN